MVRQIGSPGIGHGGNLAARFSGGGFAGLALTAAGFLLLALRRAAAEGADSLRGL